MMKKSIIVWLWAGIFFLLGQAAFAEEAPSAAGVDVQIHITGQAVPVSANVEFALSDGEWEDVGTAWIGGGQDEVITLHYDVPVYQAPKTFYFTVKGNMEALEYYGTYYAPGEPIALNTYAYTPEGAQTPEVFQTFHVTAIPLHQKEVKVAVNGAFIEDFTMPARIVDGVTMVPILELAQKLELPTAIYDNTYQSVNLAAGDRQLLYNLGTNYATLNGQALTLPKEPQFIGWTIFAPVRAFTDAFDIPLEYTDDGQTAYVRLGNSEYLSLYTGTASLVNKRGIDSQTDYLIWVSKSEFKLRVYLGSKGNWRVIKEIPVAIGKDSTPTCTGEFRYYSRESRWSYSSYYVGPIMRFNGGYAIHSTLQRYDGTPYDNRVGMKLSHGCVRVQPENMNWLISYVPLYTKIYITD